jgi:tripartite-type tricarboxylate transporter receptor subunit TctC
MSRLASFRLVLAFAMLAVAALARAADPWPNHPLRFVVVAPAGSSLDVIARLIGDKLKDRIGQPIVVENKPAAGGTAGTGEVAKSAPDGYTMVMSYNGPLAFGPFLYSKLPYDPQKDLQPVIITTNQPNLLVVNAAVPVNNVQELIAYAKANPGKFNYASVGNGSSSHLTMEWLKSRAGFDALHVPFNGAPPALTSILAGDTQALFTVPTVLVPHVKAGKLRALAVTGRTRYALLPDVPTMIEAGVKDFEANAWNGILVAAGTPPEIVARLNQEIDSILKDPEVKGKLNTAGLDPVGGSPQAFRDLIKGESERWGPVIKATGAKID